MERDLIWTWEEDGNTYVLRYKQQNNYIYDLKVYSDGFPGHKLSEYTSLHPKILLSYLELLDIIPIEKLRNLDLVDETRCD